MYTRDGGFVNGLNMFDASFFDISPSEASSMDPQQRLLLEVGFDALSRAGFSKEDLRGRKIGVFVGASSSIGLGFGDIVWSQKNVSAYTATGTALSIFANRLSYTLGLEGPSLTIDTACSSSLVALNLATQSIKLGECDVALVAGVNALLHPSGYIETCKARMLSPTGLCI